MLPNFGKCKGQEVVDLAPRTNRQQKLVNIDGDQNEKRILRWFFQALQDGISGFGIQRLRRIEDENLIPSFERLQVEHAQKITDLRDFDLCGVVVHGNRPDIGMRTGVDLSATRAFIAKIPGLSP